MNDLGSARLTKFVDGQDQNPLRLLKRIHEPGNNYYIDSVVTICLELFDHLKHSDGVADDCLKGIARALEHREDLWIDRLELSHSTRQLCRHHLTLDVTRKFSAFLSWHM